MTARQTKSIRQMADEAASSAVELEAQISATTGKTERRVLKARVRMLRQLETWFRTRNGYE